MPYVELSAGTIEYADTAGPPGPSSCWRTGCWWAAWC